MDNKIRVLIIGSDLSVKGGITSVIKSFLESNINGVEFKLLPTYIEGSNLRKINFYLKSLIKYIKAILKKDFDIAHIHMSYKGSFFRKLFIIKINNMFNIKSILHLHGSEFEVFYESSCFIVKKLIKNIFDSSDCVIVLGDKWKRIIGQISPNSNIKVFNNSVRIPEYKVKLERNRINILFLGVLIKRKGIYDLIEAIKILYDKGVINKNNLKFIIGGIGKEEEKIKELVYKYNLKQYVNLIGWVDGVSKEKLLMSSQLFILPSYNEGLPMAILEAMSYGIPVISTDVGSISEVVMNNITGSLVETGNCEELSKAIIELIKDKDTWKEYSNNCKLIIDEKFNDKKYFERISNLYNELASRNI
ncbi:glycosyltransferase family 4 protein [Clostridium baratii]|uniref:glycosyltransferase family 4 protein n=1 Tax=Clostridium baratii TaxID=1561 RepID=UPI001C23C897|nr:glycosyltransferase family 4 protein [Clostridium baratii]